MNLIKRNLIRMPLSVASWMVGICSLLSKSIRDVNPHHDGVVLAPAIAVAQGRTPNLDVFSQYGFLIPYIQGTWLKLTSVNLISLRFLTFLQILATAVILSMILKRRTGGLVAALISVSWMVSYPHLLPFLPWPSVTSTLFLISSIWSLSRIEFSNTNNTKHIFVAFIFLCLATLIRPQTSIILIAVALYFLAHSKKLNNGLINWIVLLSGVPLLVTIFAFKTGLLRAYLSQSIFWAGSNYGGLGFTVRGLVELLCVPIIGGVALAGLRLTLTPSKKLLAITFWTAAALGGILLLANFSWQYIDYPYFALKHPRVLLADLGINVLNTLSFIAFLTLVLGIYLTSTSNLRNRKLIFDSNTLILVISAFTIFQLYPATDPLHFWWVTPVFILGAMSAFNDIHFSLTSRRILVVALMLYIGLCSANFLHYQEISHVKYQSEILRGMSGPEFEVSYIDRTITILNSIPTHSSIKFDCSDGIYSVATGKYRARDENFVNWAPNYDFTDMNYDYIFQCNVKKADFVPSGFYVGEAIPVRLGVSGLRNGFENRLLIKGNKGNDK